MTLYHGRYTDDGLADEILILQPVRYEGAWLTALAYSEVISRPVPERRWEVEWQLAGHSGQQNHGEVNALVTHRWIHTPWDNGHQITTAFGFGVSWASEVPPLELASHTNEGATDWLSYMLLEVTTDIPGVDNIDLVGRIHHRSGIFGLIDGVHGGSNIITLGFSYEF